MIAHRNGGTFMREIDMEYIEYKDLLNADEFEKLYNESFVENERVDFDNLFSGVFEGFRLVGRYESGKLVGMMHYVVTENFVHLNYFAVRNDCRGKGCGSACLDWLKKTYPNKPIAVDVEEIDPTSENNDYIIKRQKFYMKNGFVHGDYVFDWRGVFFTFLHFGLLNTQDFLKHITHIFPDIKDLRKI